MILTTGLEPSEETLEHAKALAKRFGIPIVPRRFDSLAALRRRSGTDEIIVVSAKGVRLESPGAQPFFFHPNTAAFRIKRLERGDTDTMLSACQIKPGDGVLDATLGLGADAIVFAYAVGQSGRVVGIESQRTVALMVEDGLRRWSQGSEALIQAMRRVEVVAADHYAFLRQQPDRSWDVVYFDPMFQVGVDASSGIAALRPLANQEPLAKQVVQEALRVARRRVVLKEGKTSEYFRQFGFTPYRKKEHQVVYSYREVTGGE
ncbi:class I SAM-dependent methyltransferase [Brevibacillus massiliensis]|uniref:class I SAM-dependent methyltransferase n=1 Tax=Brevibacillus massiliensis TaxID=1118054 RepID=UPI0002F9C407|nr:class I SAM-dependent methyltransferase [Brevibacillus massiliensis]